MNSLNVEQCTENSWNLIDLLHINEAFADAVSEQYCWYYWDTVTVYGNICYRSNVVISIVYILLFNYK